MRPKSRFWDLRFSVVDTGFNYGAAAKRWPAAIAWEYGLADQP
ncbi:MAG: hypothetical protein ABR924_01695 [Terracidiphilus sp.]